MSNNVSDNINGEIKMLLVKALVTKVNFITELLHAVEKNDSSDEEKFKKVLENNKFSGDWAQELAVFENGKLTEWKLDLENLQKSRIQTFIPSGLAGYY